MEIIQIELDPQPITEELSPHMVRKFPWRSACTVPEALKEYVTGKFVCDVGCAEGDMLNEFSKMANRAVGIELEPDRFRFAKERGLDVICGNMFRIPDFPIADAYYLWGPSPEASINMVKWLVENENIRDCHILSGGRNGAPHIKHCVNSYNGKIISVPYREFNQDTERIEEGNWWIGVIQKKDGVHV